MAIIIPFYVFKKFQKFLKILMSLKTVENLFDNFCDGTIDHVEIKLWKEREFQLILSENRCFNTAIQSQVYTMDKYKTDMNNNNLKSLYNQLLQLCTARTAWSESDQAVRAVHSCNKW